MNLQLLTPTPTLSPHTLHPQNFEILLIYNKSLCWSGDQFVYVDAIMRKLFGDKTRNLSYRNDDRAMRPIYGCPENFQESLSTPTANFAEILNVPLFRSILWMYVQNLKFVALPVPGIIGGTQKIWAVPGMDTPTLPFLPNFS